MDPDLRDALDSSFGEGPGHRPLEDHLAAGRRALRRRRIVTAAGSVALAAVLATSYAVATGGDDTSRATDPVSRPAATASVSEPPPSGEPTTEVSTSPEQEVPSNPDDDIELTPDGRLLLAPGVEVLQRVPNPTGAVLPDRSLGVAYTRDGEETWALATYDDLGDGYSTGGVSFDPARKSLPTLEDWLSDQVALQTDGAVRRPSMVRFGVGEQLRPVAGVEILQQTGDVTLPDSFAGAQDRTAVAEVVYEGARWYVLARQIGGVGEPEYFPTAASVGGATLADFLAYAEQQYAGGEGLR